jgi:hypothetical protein
MKSLGFFLASFIVPLSIADTQPVPVPADSDSAVIATIGDRQVTVGDFVAYYLKRVEQSQPDNRPSLATPADAQQMLADILNGRAILISAENDGYDKHDEFIKTYNEFRDKTLLDELITQRERDLTVTEAEVEDFYQQLHREYRVSLILLYDENEARDLMPKLRQPGADFAALARQYSRAHPPAAKAVKSPNRSDTPRRSRGHLSLSWARVKSATRYIFPLPMPGASSGWMISPK